VTVPGLEECVRAAGGRRMTPWPDDRPVRKVTIDSREAGPGDIFVAIRGGQREGTEFLGDAAARGAVLAIVPAGSVHARALPPGLAVLEVPCERTALGRVAAMWRRRLTALRVIAITGSAGKTTTKRLVHAVLGTRLPGRAAPRSFNNDLGVPVTLLAARPSDRYLVVEIGTNAPGEIAALGRLADPDIAVVTSIGRAHLGGFGDVESILREKASLLSCLRSGGTAIVRDVDEGLGCYLRQIPLVVRFGESEKADVRLTRRDAKAGIIEVNGRRSFPLRLFGRHNAINALAAIAVGRRLGLAEEDIAAGLGSVTPNAMRLSREWIGEIDAWNDAYNANPDSMTAALDAFCEESDPAASRWVVLGTMMELGDAADALHAALAEDVAERIAAGMLKGAVFVGQYAGRQCALVRSLAGVSSAESVTEPNDLLHDLVRERLADGGAVLVKGSRALGLERMLDALRTQRIPGADPSYL